MDFHFTYSKALWLVVVSGYWKKNTTLQTIVEEEQCFQNLIPEEEKNLKQLFIKKLVEIDEMYLSVKSKIKKLISLSKKEKKKDTFRSVIYLQAMM